MKRLTEMKRDTEQTMKLEKLYKVVPGSSWSHGLIAQSVRASERNSVVVGSSPTQANFL